MYSTVLFHSENLREGDADRTAILEGFFSLVDQIPEKEEVGMTDLRTFLYFVNKEYTYWRPPPGYLSMRINPQPQVQLPLESQNIQPDDDEERYLQPLVKPLRYALVFEGITIFPKEFDIIKITAHFAAVYGMRLLQDLMMSVFMETQFESLFQFMNSTDNNSKHKLYGGFVLEGRRELMPSEKPRNDGDSKASILEECFFLIRQVFVNEVEAGVENAVNDLRGFDSSVNKWRKMMNPTPQMQPPLGSHEFAPRPLAVLEEPDPKRPKLDELALVPEDQFLAQHPVLFSSYFRLS